jgi:hypothetical protein
MDKLRSNGYVASYVAIWSSLRTYIEAGVVSAYMETDAQLKERQIKNNNPRLTHCKRYYAIAR